MNNWVYDVATQAIAGTISAAVVGAVLLYAQSRMEHRLERKRRLVESQRELLAAALQMYHVVLWTFAGTGNAERVATGWNDAHRAGAEWAAVEAAWVLPEEVLKVSRAARENLERDLQAILAMSPVGRNTLDDQRDRWLGLGNRRPFEPLEPLIAACKRA